VIGLDTNVLVRYLTQDEPKQAKLVTHLIEKVLTPTAPGFISLVVLMELYWVLSKLYRVTLPEWLDTVDALLNGTHFLVEQRDVLRVAAQTCAAQKAGFIDALIAQVAHASGCTHTASFDKAAIRFAGMTAV
jgi:predicted nucleic-acid-binding protein